MNPEAPVQRRLDACNDRDLVSPRRRVRRRHAGLPTAFAGADPRARHAVRRGPVHEIDGDAITTVRFFDAGPTAR